MSKIPSIKPYLKIVPKVYAYTTPEIKSHDGWTKIGYTEKQTVEDRVRQQVHTADIKAQIEWQQEARYTDGSGEYFTDHDFHDYLIRFHDIERKPQTEWFNVEPKKAKNLFYDFASRSYSEISTAIKGKEYTLRKEQQEAVDLTTEYVKCGTMPKEFLWNAKPRFGKTLASYDFARAINAKSVLIVTNRPSIANSWYSDYKTFIGWQTDYKFISETDALSGQGVLTRAEFSDWLDNGPANETDKARVIAFESLQGLKGSKYFGTGTYDKLKWIADTKWDLLIIDEAHEGVDTTKTDIAFDFIKRNFTLHLSGTPFKAIANSKFRSDQIFNWSYADEQEAKANWESESANPYENLPQLNMYTYQLSNMIADKINKGLDLSEDEHAEYAFDLNEFFRTENEKFVYQKDVEKFLDALTTHEKFPFSTSELRDELAHTFWLLERVDSAKAMAKLLSNHPVFKDYEVVLAAGDGKTGLESEDNEYSKKSFDKVMDAIKKHDKTITLSVGQLTTGVTVKPWTAVMMLSKMKSPAEYMQAAFRAQNPYRYQKDGKTYQKENAYVFDFAPERTLIIFDEFANSLNSSTADGRGSKEEREDNIKRLLNFFPVIGEDKEGKMMLLNAAEVLSIPRAIKAEEVVHRGFMSNFLFTNISNVFGAPKVVTDILSNIKPEEQQGQKNKTGTHMENAGDINVDEEGKVDIPEDIVVNKTEAIFGNKIYEYEVPEVEEIESYLEDDEDIEVVLPTKEDVSVSIDQLDKSTKESDLAVSEAKKIIKDLKGDITTKIKDDYNLKNKEVEKIVVQVEKEAQQKLTEVAREFTKEKNKIKTEFEIKRNEIYEKFKEESHSGEIGFKVADEAKAEVENKLADLQEEYSQKLTEASKDFAEKHSEIIQEVRVEASKKSVEIAETKKAENQKRDVENDIRARLRGFSRTIPSFIMAYGNYELRLANFDTYTPADVFNEVTGISLEQFKFLRDGGMYVDEETGEEKHFEGHLFDEGVFDDSIKNFLDKKHALSNYFDESQDEDIFDYIPPQKTNQIFTPKKVVKQMVDSLEENNPHIFEDPNKTFVDFYMKSGLYITELVKRLYSNEKMKEVFPDDKNRLKHILENQVFGFAPSKIIYAIAMSYIFGFDEEAGDISKRNFRDIDVTPYAKNGSLQEMLDEEFGDR